MEALPLATAQGIKVRVNAQIGIPDVVMSCSSPLSWPACSALERADAVEIADYAAQAASKRLFTRRMQGGPLNLLVGRPPVTRLNSWNLGQAQRSGNRTLVSSIRMRSLFPSTKETTPLGDAAMKFVMTARWTPDTQPRGCDADMEGWQILSIKGSPHVRIRRYANYLLPLKLSCAPRRRGLRPISRPGRLARERPVGSNGRLNVPVDTRSTDRNWPSTV
jgi:hypothetical protein